MAKLPKASDRAESTERADGSDGPKRWSRVLLKLSGEALQGERDSGMEPETVARLAGEIDAAVAEGVEVAVVVGGGNFWRGSRAEELGMDRVTADHVGMLATVMNALTLQDALEQRGATTRVLSAIEMNAVAEPYIRRRAMRHLEKGRVVIFAAGTGAPFFTTDSAATLRALEVHAEAMLKATMVDGIYSADPRIDPTARRYDHLDHREVLERRLAVLDATAVSLAMEHDLPVAVFSLGVPGNVTRALLGEPIGSLISTPAGPSARPEPTPVGTERGD